MTIHSPAPGQVGHVELGLVATADASITTFTDVVATISDDNLVSYSVEIAPFGTPGNDPDAWRVAMTARRPRLRYVTGRKAQIAIFLRRCLPDKLFEWLFFQTTRATHM